MRMRVGRLGMPQFIHEPAVPPMPASAPTPSGCGDKGHGIAHLAVYGSPLARLLNNIPASPKPAIARTRARTQHHAGGVSGDIGIRIWIWSATGIGGFASAIRLRQ